MNLHEHTNELLNRIAEELLPGVLQGDPLKLNRNNECFITIDEKILLLVYLDESTRALILNVPLGKLPDDSTRETIMFELLSANYCWNLTEGGTLGIDRQTGLICISYLVPLPLEEPAQMPYIISKLAAVSQHWIQTLAEYAADAAPSSTTPDATMLRA